MLFSTDVNVFEILASLEWLNLKLSVNLLNYSYAGERIFTSNGKTEIEEDTLETENWKF
jgi:hypothetical protein